MEIFRNIGKAISTLIWALLMPFFAIIRWTRDIVLCVVLYRLLKNLKGTFIVILVIPMFVMGVMENMKNNASYKLESRIEYALKNEWKGDRINVRIPAGIMYGTFSKEEAMVIAKKAEENFNERAQSRHNNRKLGFYVVPNSVYDQFIKVDWEEGNIRITNK